MHVHNSYSQFVNCGEASCIVCIITILGYPTDATTLLPQSSQPPLTSSIYCYVRLGLTDKGVIGYNTMDIIIIYKERGLK